LPTYIETSTPCYWTVHSHVCAYKARITHTTRRSMNRTRRRIRRRNGQHEGLPIICPSNDSAIALVPIQEGALKGPGDCRPVFYYTARHNSRTSAAIPECPEIVPGDRGDRLRWKRTEHEHL